MISFLLGVWTYVRVRDALERRPAPGWYDDPAYLGVHRYWDGQRWTNHTDWNP